MENRTEIYSQLIANNNVYLNDLKKLKIVLTEQGIVNIIVVDALNDLIHAAANKNLELNDRSKGNKLNIVASYKDEIKTLLKENDFAKEQLAHIATSKYAPKISVPYFENITLCNNQKIAKYKTHIKSIYSKGNLLENKD